MKIVYSSTTLLTVVNGNACYEITDHDSVHHVFTPQSTEFIAVKHAGNIHIFNLKQDGNFPDEFKEYIDAIKLQRSSKQCLQYSVIFVRILRKR